MASQLDGSFEHPKQMFNLMDKKYSQFLSDQQKFTCLMTIFHQFFRYRIRHYMYSGVILDQVLLEKGKGFMGSVLAVRPTEISLTYHNISSIFQISYLALLRCDIGTGLVGEGE